MVVDTKISWIITIVPKYDIDGNIINNSNIVTSNTTSCIDERMYMYMYPVSIKINPNSFGLLPGLSKPGYKDPIKYQNFLA